MGKAESSLPETYTSLVGLKYEYEGHMIGQKIKYAHLIG